MYEPATNTWTTRQNRDGEAVGAGGQAIGKTLYVVGGSSSVSSFEHGNVQVYDSAHDQWNYHDYLMPTARAFLAVAVVNGKLYALGGRQLNNVLGANEVFTP